MNTKKLILASAVCALLVACGGGSDAGPGVGPNLAGGVSGVTGISGIGQTLLPESGFKVKGKLENLRGEGLVLKVNGNEMPAISRNSSNFEFDETLRPGESYEIEIVSQPFAPTQTCTIKNASGSAEEVRPIDVVCETAVKYVYTVNHDNDVISSYAWKDSSKVLNERLVGGDITTGAKILSLWKNPVRSAVYGTTTESILVFNVDEKMGTLGKPYEIKGDRNVEATFGGDLIVHPSGNLLYTDYGKELRSYALEGKGGRMYGSMDLDADLEDIEGIVANTAANPNALRHVYAWDVEGKVMRIDLDAEGNFGEQHVAIDKHAGGIKKLIFDTTGKFAFAISFEANSINAYSVDDSGNLKLEYTTQDGKGQKYTDIAVDPRGEVVYTIGRVRIDPKTFHTKWTIKPDGQLIGSEMDTRSVQDRIAAVHPISGDLYFSNEMGDSFFMPGGTLTKWGFGELADMLCPKSRLSAKRPSSMCTPPA